MKNEKATLLQQVNELRDEVAKLSSANESMRDVSTGCDKTWAVVSQKVA